MRYLAQLLLVPLGLSVLMIPWSAPAQQARAAKAGSLQPGNPGANQPVPPPPPTPVADLASMEGTVLNALAGTPLRKATITMNRQGGGPVPAGARRNYAATSDTAGHFVINGIEPGTYRVNVERTGFLGMQYNARRPEGPGTPLDLARAQKLTGVDFKLTPHGVITGKVTDEDGDPMEGVQIQLMRTVYNQGHKQLQTFNGTGTNDLGEYRMAGVVPGKYYVGAIYRGRRMNPMMMDPANDSSAQEDYVTTFYPGVNDISAASVVEMGAGDQIEGVNLRLAKIHTVRVSGHVTDSAAPPPVTPPTPDARAGMAAFYSIDGGIVGRANGRIQLRLMQRSSLNPNGMNINNAAVRADGSFEFLSVPSGSYYLVAIDNQGGRAGARATRQPIDVGNTNLEGVNIAINPGAEITGHIRYDGDAPSPLPSLTVRLSPREMNPGFPPPQPAKVQDDGSFTFASVNPDLYNVNVNTPQGYYLKAVRSGNNDVMLNGLDLSNGAAPLDILMGLNPPQVGGQVVNAETGQPAVAVTVVLMPREKERQGQVYFYSTTNSDQYGNFTFNRVTPGDYQAYAFEDVQYGQWYDPDWMKPYEGKGETLSAKEGSPVTVKLTMIPAK